MISDTTYKNDYSEKEVAILEENFARIKGLLDSAQSELTHAKSLDQRKQEATATLLHYAAKAFVLDGGQSGAFLRYVATAGLKGYQAIAQQAYNRAVDAQQS